MIGISHNTAKAWISVLEASYILTLISPYHQNFNKRLIALLGIQNSHQLITHPQRGALFETWVISELLKNRFNQGLLSNIFFWRDQQGHEVDAILDNGDNFTSIEIKSGKTITPDYFTSLNYWQKISNNKLNNWLIYAGKHNQAHQNIRIEGWEGIDEIF